MLILKKILIVKYKPIFVNDKCKLPNKLAFKKINLLLQIGLMDLIQNLNDAYYCLFIKYI